LATSGTRETLVRQVKFGGSDRLKVSIRQAELSGGTANNERKFEDAVGLKAKPIIDILVGLKSFDQINQVIIKMQETGYIYAHWAGIPNDYTFRKGENITTHLIHIVEYGKNNWIHNFKFRDTLKNNPFLLKEYEQLKEDLAQKYLDSREKYTEGKGKFILAVV
jgi:GrpB-like predicted nucleotidyltransferase (UPF0157 family)